MRLCTYVRGVTNFIRCCAAVAEMHINNYIYVYIYSIDIFLFPMTLNYFRWSLRSCLKLFLKLFFICRNP